MPTARIRLTLDIPFDFVLGEVDENGHSESRIDAAKYAEVEIKNTLTNLVANSGEIVDYLVEEVRE